VLLVLALAYAKRPRTWGLVLIAGWIVTAFLLRHDLGAYAALAGAAGVGLAHPPPGRALRSMATLTGLVLLLLVPYVMYVEWSSGLLEHLRGSVEFGRSEAHQFGFPWPVLRPGDGWSRGNSAAFLFYSAYLLPPLALGLLWHPRHRRDLLVRAGVGQAIVLAVLYDAVILRHPVAGRVQDLAAIYAILGAWCAVALVRLTRAPGPSSLIPARVAVGGALAGVVAVALVSIDVLAEVRVGLSEARLLAPPSSLWERARMVVADGQEWPWRTYWPSGSPPDAVDYLHTCTRPDDRVWLTWPAPEYYVFARRGFGAGHPLTLAPHSFTSGRDQALMVARLERQRVPVVLINESTRRDFAIAYPRVDRYLRRQYTVAGAFDIRDGSVISIAIRLGWKATSHYEPHGWPCGLVPDAQAGRAGSGL
jgi:hypothetical protein